MIVFIRRRKIFNFRSPYIPSDSSLESSEEREKEIRSAEDKIFGTPEKKLGVRSDCESFKEENNELLKSLSIYSSSGEAFTKEKKGNVSNDDDDVSSFKRDSLPCVETPYNRESIKDFVVNNKNYKKLSQTKSVDRTDAKQGPLSVCVVDGLYSVQSRKGNKVLVGIELSRKDKFQSSESSGKVKDKKEGIATSTITTTTTTTTTTASVSSSKKKDDDNNKGESEMKLNNDTINVDYLNGKKVNKKLISGKSLPAVEVSLDGRTQRKLSPVKDEKEIYHLEKASGTIGDRDSFIQGYEDEIQKEIEVRVEIVEVSEESADELTCEKVERTIDGKKSKDFYEKDDNKKIKICHHVEKEKSTSDGAESRGNKEEIKRNKTLEENFSEKDEKVIKSNTQRFDVKENYDDDNKNRDDDDEKEKNKKNLNNGDVGDDDVEGGDVDREGSSNLSNDLKTKRKIIQTRLPSFECTCDGIYDDASPERICTCVSPSGHLDTCLDVLSDDSKRTSHYHSAEITVHSWDLGSNFASPELTVNQEIANTESFYSSGEEFKSGGTSPFYSPRGDSPDLLQSTKNSNKMDKEVF